MAALYSRSSSTLINPSPRFLRSSLLRLFMSKAYQKSLYVKDGY
jgi:hypothetical protein